MQPIKFWYNCELSSLMAKKLSPSELEASYFEICVARVVPGPALWRTEEVVG